MEPDGADSAAASALGGWSTLVLGILLILTLLVRLQRLNQPIVENYVGRQIPTAMVARNLDRGLGFFKPQLDTGPFPNLFLVEPPVYEQLVVWLKHLTGLTLEESGRVLSAIGMTLAAWGLFGLARRREGSTVALLSVLAFSAFPVTIRFGRSFQPDALMLGLLLMGLSLWDRVREHRSGRISAALIAGWVLLASGLALKITSAYLLVPLVVCLWPATKRPTFVGLFTRGAVAASTLLPAMAWYLWANHLVDSGGGSRASADNRAIWLQVLAPTALLSAQVWLLMGKYLLWRCFTPLGMVLALGGFWLVPGRDSRVRLWLVWGASATAAMLVLAAKLHHEYYWLAIAPIMAVGVSLGIRGSERRFRRAGWIVAAVFLGFCGYQSRLTWQTPPEWIHLEEAGRIVRASVPPSAWVVAPEALLFQGDRRGCRLEFSERGCRRAAGEWETPLASDTAIDLVEMYRAQGARYFADLGLRDSSVPGAEAERVALHEAIRRRYKVIVDLPAILLAELN